MNQLYRKIILLFFLLGVFSGNKVFSQDSSRLRISLLTCTPGEELYSIFGHSAVRIIDSNSVSDYVYNYGTFNFDDKDFYVKFIRGKLLYYVSIERFDEFQYNYQMEGRGITEQLLALSPLEKIKLKNALIENLKEENKYYKYDFFLDNCTTRLRDLMADTKHPHPILPAVMPVDTKFREAIHLYLNQGEKYWSKLGIDLLLGAPTDQVMTPAQQQFLPDNLMTALDSCTNEKMVLSRRNLYYLDNPHSGEFSITPLIFFSLLLVLMIALSFFKNASVVLLLKGLDGLLFFSTGLLGFLLIFMWVGTDHSMTKNNYNILWALPTHLFASFFISSKKNSARKYFLFSAIVSCMILLCWFFLPQKMNTALIPLVLLLFIRSAKKSYR